MRLYAYLVELNRTKDVEGAVVEVGTRLAGTSALAHRFVRQIGVPRRYVCIDTFSGFVQRQFEDDLEVGVPIAHRNLFAHNSGALNALYPRMAPGGVILVDDCPKVTSWVGGPTGVPAMGRRARIRTGPHVWFRAHRRAVTVARTD